MTSNIDMTVLPNTETFEIPSFQNGIEKDYIDEKALD